MDKQTAINSYVERGWALVPIRPRDKKPLVAWSIGSIPTTPSPEQVKEWFTQWPDADVGILTGRRSGRLVVVDIDPKNGGTRPWDLPATLTASTPSGGEHLYFSGDRTNAAPGLQGIDIRGEGGLVVAPPAWGREWTADDPIVDLPDWWGKMPTGRPRRPQINRRKPKHQAERILDGLCERVRTATPGNRNATLFKSACFAFERCLSLGVDVIEERLREADSWDDGRTGLSDEATLQTIASARTRILGMES